MTNLNHKEIHIHSNSQMENSNEFHVNVLAEVIISETIDNHVIKEEDLLNHLVETN